ncbi:MAG: hypothetical protein U9P50_00300 [Patescibacteria group bacterium]|nr:hypothetical protein [Patescibacteria group bacterium]
MPRSNEKYSIFDKPISSLIEDSIEEPTEDFIEEPTEDFIRESIEEPKKILIKDLAEKLYLNTECHVDLMYLAASFTGEVLKKFIRGSLTEEEKKEEMRNIRDVQKMMNILKTTAYIQKNIVPTAQEEVMNLAWEQLERLT